MPPTGLTDIEKVSLTPQRRVEVRKSIISEKLGDKLVVYLLWTWAAPWVAIALGSIGSIEAIKPSSIYAFNIGVTLAGFGELVTKSVELHRRMHAMLFCSCGIQIALIFAWIWSAEGTGFTTRWTTAGSASLLTAVIVGGDIVVGVTRDAYEEVKAWTK